MAKQSVDVGRLAARGECLTPACIKTLRHIFRECEAAGEVADHLVVSKQLHMSAETAWRAFEYLRCQTDVTYFLKNYCKVRSPQGDGALIHAAKFEPAPLQLEYVEALTRGRKLPSVFDLNSTEDRRIHFTKKARQEGWTTTTGLFMLHAALFQQQARIAIISLAELASMDVLTGMMFTYRNIPNWLKRPFTKDTETKIRFDNGSEIVAMPTNPTSSRSVSATMIMVDEGATIQNVNKWARLWTAVQGATSQAGIATIGSTCDCAGDTPYAQLVEDVKAGKKRACLYHEWPWDTLPWHTEQWLELQHESSDTEASFQTEYMMRWIGTGNPFMPIEIVQHSIDELMDVQTKYDIPFASRFGINPTVGRSSIAGKHIAKQWKPRRREGRYMMGLDLALGVARGDNSAMVVIDQKTMEVVLTYHSSRNGLNMVVEDAYKISDIYNRCTICPETNGLGIMGLQRASQPDLGLSRLWRPGEEQVGIIKMKSASIINADDGNLQPKDYGFYATNERKQAAYQKLKDMIIAGELIIYDPDLLIQLMNITMDANRRIHAETGHDDLADALAIAVFASDFVKPSQPNFSMDIYTEPSHIEQVMDQYGETM